MTFPGKEQGLAEAGIKSKMMPGYKPSSVMENELNSRGRSVKRIVTAALKKSGYIIKPGLLLRNSAQRRIKLLNFD